MRTALACPAYRDDPQYAIVAQVNLGSALIELGRHDEAVDGLQNACIIYANLVEVALRRDQLQTARKCDTDTRTVVHCVNLSACPRRGDPGPAGQR
ncbi:hypothetical protein KIF24_16195 [Micromonospora sp. Llam7]|uniref:hypothetical protein n=1 Tax=Micromonospora tarapacensis TaxID=2835305 RepID=UPI001C82B325|nr:hypothetical protein [Micromonospora tarapacensis]MBX7267417.1 hypothetical protein [Micromonospora tarapacensis]